MVRIFHSFLPRILALALFPLLFSCGDDGPVVPKEENKMTLSFGYDSLVFTGYAPLQDKPVKVYYVIPETGNLKTMPILFAMHGADRNGPYQIDTWRSIVEDKGVILIAPQFTKALYPEINYQYGGVSYSSSSFVAREEELWTYQIIESLFDYFKENTGNRSKTYDIWGHSAGSQFTHRFLLFMENARVRRAVSSNAGSYTFPSPDGVSYNGKSFGYPYSIKDAGRTKEQLAKYFARDLTVHLGKADTATTREQDSQLPVSDGAEAQGKCRYERGKNFYATARHIADSVGLPFNWKLVEVPGVPHSSRRMVQTGSTGAAYLMYYAD